MPTYLFQLLLQVQLFQDSHVISAAAVSVNINAETNGRGSFICFTSVLHTLKGNISGFDASQMWSAVFFSGNSEWLIWA